METRLFGRTGLQISNFTFGGGWVGGLLIHQDEETKLKALTQAADAGCNWIDTAASYGNGQSEEALGRLLPKLNTKPHISSKFRIDTESGKPIEEQIDCSLEESLDRLKLTSISLFQLHNRINTRSGNGSLSPAEALRAGSHLARLAKEGHFDHIGLTALGETPAILQVIDANLFDTAQIYYNLLNPSAGTGSRTPWGGQDFSGLIAACQEKHMGMMNIRVLAGGALASPNRHGREVAVTTDADLDQEHLRADRLFSILGDQFGTRAQTSIRYALAEHRLSTTIVGLASLDHLSEALMAFKAGPLPASALHMIEASYPGV